ncbi:unnamed protein product, partial [Brassica rapa]
TLLLSTSFFGIVNALLTIRKLNAVRKKPRLPFRNFHRFFYSVSLHLLRRFFSILGRITLLMFLRRLVSKFDIFLEKMFGFATSL